MKILSKIYQNLNGKNFKYGKNFQNMRKKKKKKSVGIQIKFYIECSVP